MGVDSPPFVNCHPESRGNRDGNYEANGIIERAMTEHNHQDAKQAVHDTAQRAPVRVATRAEAAIVRRTGGVVLETDESPVIGGLAQPGLTRNAHPDHATLPPRLRVPR